jgi:hypothetical protein
MECDVHPDLGKKRGNPRELPVRFSAARRRPYGESANEEKRFT